MSETADSAPGTLFPGSLSSGTLFLARRHFETLLHLLAKHAPGKEVSAFGSRATGRYVWRFSDIDLAVEGTLSPKERYDLQEAFEESNLPVKVDVVELGRADTAFAERIRPDLRSLRSPASRTVEGKG